MFFPERSLLAPLLKSAICCTMYARKAREIRVLRTAGPSARWQKPQATLGLPARATTSGWADAPRMPVGREETIARLRQREARAASRNARSVPSSAFGLNPEDSPDRPTRRRVRGADRACRENGHKTRASLHQRLHGALLSLQSSPSSGHARCLSVSGEAVEQAGAAGGFELILLQRASRARSSRTSCAGCPSIPES